MPSTTINCNHTIESDLSALGAYSNQTEDAATMTSGTDTVGIVVGGSVSYPQYRCYVDIPVSSLTANSIINSATLNMHSNSASTFSSTSYRFCPCTGNEHYTSGASNVFTLANASAPYQTLNNLTSTGAIAVTLGGTALSDISNAISSTNQTFTIGIVTSASAQDFIQWAGQSDGTNKPTLTINYSTPTVINLFMYETVTVTDTIGLGLALTMLEIIRRGSGA